MRSRPDAGSAWCPALSRSPSLARLDKFAVILSKQATGGVACIPAIGVYGSDMSSQDSRPPLRTDTKAFNEKLIQEFRANNGKLTGPMAGARQPLLLTTTGGRSGSPRTVVLGFRMDGDRYLVIASNNGNDPPPQWYRNLERDPAA